MKRIVALLFLLPGLLSAQSEIQGNDWRFSAANTTPFAISEESPDIQAPKCLVDDEIQQCILEFSGLTFNRDFPGGGNNADRLWLPKWRLIVEPFNPLYESGTTVMEIGPIITMPVLYIQTDANILAICNVSLVQSGEFYLPAGWQACGDDIMVPTVAFTGPDPSALTPIDRR